MSDYIQRPSNITFNNLDICGRLAGLTDVATGGRTKSRQPAIETRKARHPGGVAGLSPLTFVTLSRCPLWSLKWDDTTGPWGADGQLRPRLSVVTHDRLFPVVPNIRSGPMIPNDRLRCVIAYRAIYPRAMAVSTWGSASAASCDRSFSGDQKPSADNEDL
jgi:hypothetical protein